MTRGRSAKTIVPLFLVLFIDGMGLSLLFPILSSIIIDPHSSFLPAHVGASSRSLLYGMVVGIFMLCWFFGAAILGDLSDSVGRKKSLLICLLGAFLGYLISAFAVTWHSLLFLILGRVVAGFTAGSQPIAQAAIVDVSHEKHKARNIGLILLALSLGFVLGPVIGGVLSDHRIVSWFNFSTPLYFASLISILNAILLLSTFNETFNTSAKINIQLSRAIQVFISAFQHRKVRFLSLIFLIMIYGWSNFFTFISIFSIQLYNFSPTQVSLLLADMGVGFSIGCGFLVDYFVKRFEIKLIVAINLIITAIFIILLIITHSQGFLWAIMVFIGATISIGYSGLITLFSNQVDRHEQGWVMGVTGAVMALCFGLTSFLTGYLANFGATIPMWLAVAGIGFSGLLMTLFQKSEQV